MTQIVNRPNHTAHDSFDTPTSKRQPLPGQRSRRSTLQPVQPEPVVPDKRVPVDVLFEPPGHIAASMRPLRPTPKGTGYLTYRYQIAGLVTVGSQIPLPELEFFREPWLGQIGRASCRERGEGAGGGGG